MRNGSPINRCLSCRMRRKIKRALPWGKCSLLFFVYACFNGSDMIHTDIRSKHIIRFRLALVCFVGRDVVFAFSHCFQWSSDSQRINTTTSSSPRRTFSRTVTSIKPSCFSITPSELKRSITLSACPSFTVIFLICTNIWQLSNPFHVLSNILNENDSQSQLRCLTDYDFRRKT